MRSGMLPELHVLKHLDFDHITPTIIITITSLHSKRPQVLDNILPDKFMNFMVPLKLEVQKSNIKFSLFVTKIRKQV